MITSSDILVEFKRITGKDIEKFFTDAISFFKNDQPIIVNYYSGISKSIESKNFQKFDSLWSSKDVIFEAFHSHSRVMKDSRWWDLLEAVEQIDNSLQTLKNINRWSRSSITSFAYSPNVQIDYTLSQNDTLEKVSRDILGDNSYQDAWVDIAFSNKLREEDYSTDGGNDLKLLLEKSTNLKIVINSVVDTISGKSIYGKDFYKKIQWFDNDLLVLGYDDTIKQSVERLILLKKNDNQDVPNLGLQKSTISGSNRVLMNFPIIVRQLTEVFSSDDSLKDFSIISLSVEQDNTIINYSVKTRLGETLPWSTLILN